MLEKVMQQTLKMTPTWCQNGDRNRSKIHKNIIQKNITKNDAKIMRQKAIRPEGPWARSARRGKEFLWRLQVKVPSCIQHPAKNKHPANNQKAT